jgi:hypothetical protein
MQPTKPGIAATGCGWSIPSLTNRGKPARKAGSSSPRLGGASVRYGFGISITLPCTSARSTLWWAVTTSSSGRRAAITGLSSPAASWAKRRARSSRYQSGCFFFGNSDTGLTPTAVAVNPRTDTVYVSGITSVDGE